MMTIGAANTAAMTGGLRMMAVARDAMRNSWMRRMMVIDEKALEAAARAIDDTYDVSRSGEILNLPQVTRAAITAYLGALDGVVLVPVELLQRTVTMRDDFWEQDVIDLLAARPQNGG